MKQLPKIALPTTRETLPDSGQRFKMRPLTGQEFEILLAAKESKDEDNIIDSTFDVLDSIIIDPPKFDSRNLTPLDFDFTFSKMMISSYGKSNIDIDYLCRNPVTKKSKDGEVEKECGNRITLNIDLEKDVTYEALDKNDNEIDIDGVYKVILGDINATHILHSEKSMFDLAAHTIDRLVDTRTEEEWKFQGPDRDVDEKAALVFAKTSLSSTALKKIGDYFRSYGRMEYQGKIKCKKCGKVHDIKLKGFMDFFTSPSDATT